MIARKAFTIYTNRNRRRNRKSYAEIFSISGDLLPEENLMMEGAWTIRPIVYTCETGTTLAVRNSNEKPTDKTIGGIIEKRRFHHPITNGLASVPFARLRHRVLLQQLFENPVNFGLRYGNFT